MTSVFYDSPLSDDERRAELYRGGIFVYSPTPESLQLVELAADMLAEAFAPHDPRSIQDCISAEECAAVLGGLKPAFIHHPRCKELIPALLSRLGCDPDKLYFDVPRLRSAYPSRFLTSGIAYAFHPHRDTWYSAPMCQINWWTPVFPIVAENCMAFYPGYFDKPVKNGSHAFNYYEWNSKSRAAAVQHVGRDTREQPKPLEPIDQDDLRILAPPGGIIVFSGAHLHETVENTAGAARYSIDFRTVHYDDVVTRCGAPNVDSRCTGTTMRDYLRSSDLTHLPDDAVKLYDDGTEVRGDVLYFGDRLARSP